jgi:hypothetical protein
METKAFIYSFDSTCLRLELVCVGDNHEFGAQFRSFNSLLFDSSTRQSSM